ncbi:MAG: hypothetical protein AMXMBFR7_43900 [Planctomycetota bacterium]
MMLRCISDRTHWFKKGHFYDVVEIMEFPDHVMVRERGQPWPVPGEPFWGWHPETLFKCPKDGLEILSCGYSVVEIAFYGVVFRRSWRSLPARLRKLLLAFGDRGLPWPKGASYRNVRQVLPKVSYTQVGKGVACKSVHLPSSFTMLGYEGMALLDMGSMTRMKRELLTFLKQAGCREQSEAQYVEYWQKNWRVDGKCKWID